MDFTIEHIGLAALDTARLKDWYVAVFGAQVVFDNGGTPASYLLKFKGGMIVEIYPGEQAPGNPSLNKLTGWRHVAIRVDSIEKARPHLVQKGVVIDEEVKPAGGGGLVLFFKDPAGNLLHLVERTGRVF